MVLKVLIQWGLISCVYITTFFFFFFVHLTNLHLSSFECGKVFWMWMGLLTLQSVSLFADLSWIHPFSSCSLKKLQVLTAPQGYRKTEGVQQESIWYIYIPKISPAESFHHFFPLGIARQTEENQNNTIRFLKKIFQLINEMILIEKTLTGNRKGKSMMSFQRVPFISSY